MPYILYTLGAHSAVFCHAVTSRFGDMSALARGARALCAYPLFQQVNNCVVELWLMSDKSQLLGGTKVPFVATDAFIPRRHWHKP